MERSEIVYVQVYWFTVQIDNVLRRVAHFDNNERLGGNTAGSLNLLWRGLGMYFLKSIGTRKVRHEDIQRFHDMLSRIMLL